MRRVSRVVPLQMIVGAGLLSLLACGGPADPEVARPARASDLVIHASLAPDTLAPARDLVPVLVASLRNVSSDPVLIAPHGSPEASGIFVCVIAAEGASTPTCSYELPGGDVSTLAPGDSVVRSFGLDAFAGIGLPAGAYLAQAGYVPRMPETTGGRVSSRALPFTLAP
ncbi:MAG TPA: hypothetical protein VF041_00100 [Gemmatimonadaceae bacterium]